MTPQSSAAASLTLDPATTDETLATIFAAQRRDPDRTPAQLHAQREAAAALVASLHPREPTEAAYAVRAAAAHYGAMECFRRAMLPEVPDHMVIRWHGKAVALSRMNMEMVRTLRQCQAEPPRAQPQPAARPSLPAPPVPAARPAAAPTQPPGKENPMPSERPPPAQPATAQPATAQPAAVQPAAAQAEPPAGRQHRMVSAPPPPPLTAAAVAAQLAAALHAKPAGKPACPRALDPRDPMSSERPPGTPSTGARATGPAATADRSAPPPGQTLCAELLGAAADVAPLLAAATARIRLHVQ